MSQKVSVLDQVIHPRYSIYHGDSCEVIKGIPDNSLDYIIFSPPFSSLYTYSASDRDMGNSADDAAFYQHYGYLVAEMFRALKPGRLLSFHCMNLPTSKSRDGYIGIKDFRGDLIRMKQKAGFIYHSEVCIWKDPVTAMQRTKALGLLYKQLRKDAAMSRQGIPDYLVTMRKPGDNPNPVRHYAPEEEGGNEAQVFPVGLWQEYASPVYGEDIPADAWMPGMLVMRGKENRMADNYPEPVWLDINPSDTLQYRSAREHNDERHICLAAGSLVLTREFGYLEIEDVEPGDFVLTHNGRWMPVLAKRCNGIAETIRTSAQGVANLVTTPDHKLWAKRAVGTHEKQRAMESKPEWIEANSTLSSYLNLQLPPVEDNELTTEEWWIIGRWLGDGHKGYFRTSGKRNGKGQYIISCAHDEADDLIARLEQNAGHVCKRTATQIALIGLRPEMRDVLSRCGSGAENKRLPGEAAALSKEKAEALLTGYLSADGHYVEKHDRVMASSISRALLLGMAMIAQRARGCVASVYPGRPERDGEIQGRSVKMRQDWIMSFRNSDGRAKSGWIDENGAWKKVRKIEEFGEAEVWDLQIAGDASFTAEGCIVHNCPLQLEVIRRGVRLWTNPNDVVFTPFMGIGSELYVSLQEGRRGVGCELKASYYQQSARNLPNALANQNAIFAGL